VKSGKSVPIAWRKPSWFRVQVVAASTSGCGPGRVHLGQVAAPGCPLAFKAGRVAAVGAGPGTESILSGAGADEAPHPPFAGTAFVSTPVVSHMTF